MREFNETHEIRKVQPSSWGQMAFSEGGGDCVISPDLRKWGHKLGYSFSSREMYDDSSAVFLL